MNQAELLREVLLGRLLIVGEFRGAHAAMDGYVDRTTGEKVGYVKAILLAECTVGAIWPVPCSTSGCRERGEA